MCDEQALTTIVRGRQAATRLLNQCFRASVQKALRLHSPGAFDHAVATLAAKLRALSGPADRAAARDALAILDVDWSNTTSEQRDRLVDRATHTAALHQDGLVISAAAVLWQTARAFLGATRRDARNHDGLNVGVDFNALDDRITKHMQRSETYFVRDEHGRRLAAFSQKARDTIAAGLAQGLGRADLAHAVGQAAEQALVLRNRFYWDIVAASFAGRARSYGQVSAFAEAGIERYAVHAVLDERTTAFCRFMDGKEFVVRDAINLIERVASLQNPDQIKDAQPWGREGINPDTGRAGLYVARGGERRWLATVERSGVGMRDDPGHFTVHQDGRDLHGCGLSLPPYHGCCRTQVQPM